MATKAQKIRLGIFIIISCIALVGFIAFITSERYLHPTDTYFIAFENVSVRGLEVGSPVNYLGIKVGTVKNIRIHPQKITRIVVEVALQPGTPVKQDARANISSVGITGVRVLEIRGSSDDAALLEEGDFIRAGSSSGTEEITGTAEVVLAKMEKVLNNLQQFTAPENLESITRMAEDAQKTSRQIRIMLENNQRGVRQMLQTSQRVANQLDTLSGVMLKTARTVNKLQPADISRLQESIRLAHRLMESLDYQVSRSGGEMLSGLKALRRTLQHLNEIAQIIRDDPAVLVRGAENENAGERYLEDVQQGR